MSIRIDSSNPEALLKDFKKKIDKGTVQTWSYDQDGDFTHTPEQWKNKAWLRPKISGGQLVLTLLKPQNQNITALIYAIYHGRFIESVLVHCDSLFTRATSTALPSDGDMVS